MTNAALEQTNKQSKRLTLTDKLLNRLGQVIDETDEQAAAARVAKMQVAHPNEPVAKLADRLIASKSRETAVIGATTSAAAIIPGVGTFAGLALGVAADFGVTFKLQAELVLEIATLYGRVLSPSEKRRAVLLVTGLSAGTTTLAHRAGNHISRRVAARAGSKYVTGALPVAGVVASASTNAVMTYIIGQRARAYFSLGPEAMDDWRLTAQALTGLNRDVLVSGGKKIKAAGGTAVAGVKKAGSSLIHRRKQTRPELEEIIPVFDAP
ncbi:MAG: hypothetical protein IPM39_04935 [Chloroflexi bacterium]|nr:hypothetical protein [Chloroflexota bacterium]